MTFFILLISIVLFFILFAKLGKVQERLSALERRQLKGVIADEEKTAAPAEPAVATVAEPPRAVADEAAVPATKETYASEIPTPPSPTPATPLSGQVPGITPPAEQYTAAAAMSSASSVDPLRWFKEHALIKVGAVIFFLGAVWFVSYAISQGWISPATRIYLGILLGVGVLVAARLLQKRAAQQFLVLTVLGSGIVIASVYAGQFLFSVFAPLVAMALLLVVIGYTVFVSVHSKTQWLGLLSAIAALVAPLLINNPEYEPILFFFYLFVISLGFSMVVLKTTWRAITLTLTVGVVLYLLQDISRGEMGDELVWFFTVLFSALFFVVSSLSLRRTKEPHPSDLTTLGIISVVFLVVAHQYALSPALAAFVSMAVVAGTGYYFHLLALPKQAQAVYAAIACLHLVVGTSFLFDGFKLTLAYAAEVTILLMAALYAKLSARAVGVTAGLIILPVTTSLSSITAQSWQSSALHADAVTLYGFILALFMVVGFAWQLHRRGGPEWQRTLAGCYGLLGYGYVVLVVALVASAVAITDVSRDVLMYVVWTLMAILFLLLIDRLKMPLGWRIVMLVSLLLPAATSLRSMISDSWDKGVLHVDSYGLLFMLGVSVLAAAFNLRQFLAYGQMIRLRAAGLFLSSTYLYGVILTGLAAGAVFTDSDVANVVRMVSWTFISYVFVTVLFALTVPTRWVLTSLITLVLPLILAAVFLIEESWESPLSIEAVGLYFVTTVLVFLAITLKRQLPYYKGDRATLAPMIAPLLVVAGISAVRCVWLFTHSIIAENDYAAMITLFVYTIVGLGCYLFGAHKQDRVTKLVGVLLLTGVVLRLLLVEVWDMDEFWRIITFMVIGALFIAAALLETKNRKAALKETSDPSA